MQHISKRRQAYLINSMLREDVRQNGFMVSAAETAAPKAPGRNIEVRLAFDV
jgi:hypothetical protein